MEGLTYFIFLLANLTNLAGVNLNRRKNARSIAKIIVVYVLKVQV